MKHSKPFWNKEFNCPQDVIDELDTALMELVSLGYVNMSTDEHGEFYFSITENGIRAHDNYLNE